MTALLVSPLDTIGISLTDLRLAKTVAEYYKCRTFCESRDVQAKTLLSMSGFQKGSGTLPVKDIRNLVMDPAWRKRIEDGVTQFLGSVCDEKDKIVLLMPTCTLKSDLVDDIKKMAFRALVPVRKIEDYFSTSGTGPFTLDKEEVSVLSRKIEKRFFDRFVNPTKSREKGEIVK